MRSVPRDTTVFFSRADPKLVFIYAKRDIALICRRGHGDGDLAEGREDFAAHRVHAQ